MCISQTRFNSYRNICLIIFILFYADKFYLQFTLYRFKTLYVYYYKSSQLKYKVSNDIKHYWRHNRHIKTKNPYKSSKYKYADKLYSQFTLYRFKTLYVYNYKSSQLSCKVSKDKKHYWRHNRHIKTKNPYKSSKYKYADKLYSQFTLYRF